MNKTYSKYSFRALVGMLREAFLELIKNDPLRMAGATAFFTSFALPPILIILTQALGLIFSPAMITEKFFETLRRIVGRASAMQIVQTLTAVRRLAHNWYMTIGGFIFLLFVATTLFKVIKSSLDQLWRIRVIKKRNVWIRARSRVQSVLVILAAGLLFMAGLLGEAAQAFLGKYIYQVSPALTFYLNSGLNYLLSVAIVTLWFAVLFRYLPDGRPEWKVAITGAFVTSILFNTGKLVLHWLLVRSSIKEIYGASGSAVLVLLFVFYSSLILYYGAAFTKIWGAWHDKPILPLPHAVHFRLAEVVDGVEN